jgi:hypothetical protein
MYRKEPGAMSSSYLFITDSQRIGAGNGANTFAFLYSLSKFIFMFTEL